MKNFICMQVSGASSAFAETLCQALADIGHPVVLCAEGVTPNHILAFNPAPSGHSAVVISLVSPSQTGKGHE